MTVGLLILALAGQVSLRSELSVPDSLTIGDRFHLRAELVHPRDLPVSPPAFDAPGPFVLVSVDSTRGETGDTVRRTYDFEVAAFATGELAVPPLRVSYLDDGEERGVLGDSLAVTVTSVLSEDMEALRDIKPILPFPSYLWAYLLAAFVLAGLLVFGGLWFLRRHRRPKEALLPPRPPWEVALDTLTRLPFAEWIEEGAFKPYYFALSEVLKRYLEGRYGFAAVEGTTTEVLQAMRERRISERDSVRDFFEGADTVKYAKRAPTDAEMRAAHDEVKGLVERTIPKPEDAEGGDP